MKSILLSIIVIICASIASYSQDKKVVEDKIKVSGICEMCKVRIEDALDITGVKYAEWDVNTQILSIAYRKDKISEEEIHKCLSAVGHDTEKVTALDSVYLSVDMCCRYRDKDVVDQHKKDDH